MPARDSSSNGEHEGTIESLNLAVGKLRRDAAALNAENRERRAEVALPRDARAPGAARRFVDHCLSGLVTQRVLQDAQMLVSELVTNSLHHGGLRDGDSVLVSVYLASDTLRLEVQNPGTAGVVAASRAGRESGHGGFGLDLVDLLAGRWGVMRNRNTTVWFEMARV